MYTLFLDSDCDVTKKDAEACGAKLVSMPYDIDGKTIYPYEDFYEFNSRAFYDQLRGGVLPTTFALSEEKYIEYFEPEFAAGRDILYAHFSAAMTVTFDVMDGAVKKLKEKYPERRFYEIDTKGITIISYNIICEIIDLYKAGKTPEEIIAWANKEVGHFAQYFFADDLKFFRRSGRVGGLAATMGTMIGIRPIITMSEEGKMESIGTVKGRAKAMDRLLSYVDELGDDIEHHRVVIGHTDAPELAEELRRQLLEKYPGLHIVTVITNPTAGSHCGPNGVGISFHAIHR